MTLTVTKPTVNGSNNQWGSILNQALDDIVSAVNDTNTTVDALDTTVGAIDTFPSGGIVMWSGTIANIPTGWNLCDGTNGTPNLVDRFIVGSTSDSGATHDIGDTGGANSLTLTEGQLPSHTHSFSGTSSSSSISSTSIDTVRENTGGGNISVGNNTLARVREKNDAFDRRNVDQNIGGSHTHTFSGTTGSTGSGASIDNRPAYYALAFIMKV